MQNTTHQIIMNAVIVLVAGGFATAIYRRIAPYLFRRHGEAMAARLARVASEQEQAALKQRDLNMTRGRALRVRLTNVGILLGFLLIVGFATPRLGFSTTNSAVLTFGAYVLVGYIAVLLARVVPSEALQGLNWNSRIDVRLYYVWLWPLNVFKTVTAKH
ncbi:hypothetical protein [Burkholderia sp. A2]|uniref:hypothetical protein n=1 Tax=Burkholderia sp. A2 TaxID=236253 RepID=UPI00084C1529|nr:hypothetical protein [Burkholderia sp. A2]OED09667.1 hypothetical protein A9Z05_31135 [Burkholderia sp. A2]